MNKLLEERRLLRAFKFFIKFNLFSVPLYLILVTGTTWPWLQQMVTDITYNLLVAAGYNPSVNGFIISIPVINGDWGAFINWDCTGWKSLLAFFALVMATDFPIRRRLLGLALLPIVFAANILRIFFMFFYVKTFDLANYQLVHAVVWSWGLILLILVLWLVWMKYDFTKLGKKPPAAKKTKRNRRRK